MFESLAYELPQAFRFLEPGWLALHLVAIPTIFALGMLLGKRRTGTYPGTYPGTT